mgnify:CR=1 FL=1
MACYIGFEFKRPVITYRHPTTRKELMSKKQGIKTRAIHTGYEPESAFGSLAPPIFQTATFTFESTKKLASFHVGESTGFFYTRYANPTLAAAEARLSRLEGAKASALYASGMAAVGQAGMSAAVSPLKRAVGDSYRSGSRAAFEATGGKFSNSPSSMPTPANDGPPAWARRMKRQQSLHHGTAVAAHAIRSGDGGGAGTAISLSERS